MTTFPCFASSFDFFTNGGIVDVATIITDFRARVTGQTPAWTEPVADTFKSPVDGVGRFFEVTLNRLSATQLEFIVTDQNAITICDRSIEISGGGDTVNYYTGQFHAWIEILVATPEVAQSGILDETPLAENAIQNYVWGNGYRNAGGGIDGGGSTFGQEFALDNGSSSDQSRFRAWGVATNGAVPGLRDGAGNLQYFPVDMFINIAGTNEWIGRMYQAYLCDQSIPAGTLKTVPIDTTGLVLGTFRVIGGLGQVDCMKVAVRVA